MSVRIIKSVMTPFPYSVDIGSSITDAEAMMRAHGIHHLPVKSGDELVGVLSATDLRSGGGDSGSIAEVMQTEPYVVELGTALESVLLHMADNHIECVLVTKEGRLAGIFTVVDACRAFSKELGSQRSDGSDAA